MTTEHRKRKPVFQESGAEEPVVIDKPFVSAPEPVHVEEIDAAPDVAAVATPHTGAPATDDPADVFATGWQLITPAQHTGRTYLVTADPDKEGTRAFWRKTRVLNHFKWTLHGKWSDALTRADLVPEPIYYREP